jgi:hypothetical protein
MIAALCSPIYLSQRNLRTAIIEGSLEVKLPTIWTDETQRWEKSGKRREEKRRDETRRDETRRDETRREEKRKRRRRKIKEGKFSLCFSNGLWLRRVEK